MLYRDFREYDRVKNPDFEPLRSWLRGDTGTESLKDWLSAMYA